MSERVVDVEETASIGSARSDRSGLRHLITLYFRLVGARSRSQMQYKFSFGLLVANGILATVVDFVEVLVIFGRIPTLAGWSLGEVAMLYGTAAMSFALAEMFARGFELLSQQVVQGQFDRVLTRPLGAFFQVFATELALWKVGRLGQGLIILLIAVRLLAIQLTATKVLVLLLAIASGAVIFYAIFVIGAATCFWTVESNEIVNVFTNGGVLLTSYPLEIYQDWLRRLVTFVLPLGFINYYPVLFVLGRPDPFELPWWMRLLSPLVALVVGLVAWALWSTGVRHYQSTGT
ncbi:MAG TPA: ABC-2 family transporter protein [Chloroflexota bacterium]|nr:ABC-2 family transporter protein [Chloroflexota bacterium]